MLDMFKKSFYAGMGALSLTKEKAEKIVGELVEKGEITAEEAKKVANEILEKGQQEKNAVGDYLRKEFAKMKKEMGLVDKEQWETLVKKVSELEKKIEMLEEKK